MKSKIEIIKETVEYYSNNPRSINTAGTSCLYNGPNGEKCAFSRCCVDDASFIEGTSADSTLGSLSNQNILKEEYRGHDGIFWNNVQALHDLSANWNDEGNGLSDIGIERVNKLIQRYS